MFWFLRELLFWEFYSKTNEPAPRPIPIIKEKIKNKKKHPYEFDDTDDSDSVVYMEKSWFH